MKIQNIIIRREYKTNEFRTPLIPVDCKKCIDLGITVYVEKSSQRCFTDEEYLENGCIIIEDFTKLVLLKNETLVIGLKELDYNNLKQLPWCHLYFTHIFKNQIGSEEIIDLLKKNHAIIYDYEYFLNQKYFLCVCDLDLPLNQYLPQHYLPQFYFHILQWVSKYHH